MILDRSKQVVFAARARLWPSSPAPVRKIADGRSLRPTGRSLSPGTEKNCASASIPALKRGAFWPSCPIWGSNCTKMFHVKRKNRPNLVSKKSFSIVNCPILA